MISQYDDLVREDRVHRSLYTDSAIFDDEMQRIFGRVWVYLAHESELPNPGDRLLRPMGTRPVLLTRGPYLEISARLGATLGSPRSSTPGDPEGQKSVRVDTHRGLVFGTLDPDPPGLLEYLGPAAALIGEWVDHAPDGDIVVRGHPRKMGANTNWKLYLDGAADGLHPLFTHRSYLDLLSRRGGSGALLAEFRFDPDATGMYSLVLPNGHQFLDQRPSRKPTRWGAMGPAPGRESTIAAIAQRYGETGAEAALERVAFRAMNLFVFPNLSLVENSIGVVCPIAVDRTEVHWYRTRLAGAEPEGVALGFRFAEESDNFIDVDDIENWERVQRGLAGSPDVEWLHTGRGLEGTEVPPSTGPARTVPVTNEAPMRAYHREWARLMDA